MVKVYLVEDEIIIRQSIKNSIDWEKEGYEFVGDASDGELALPVILKEKPDILITDIRMPFMDGLELIERVKAIAPSACYVILSGYREFEYAKRGMTLGVKDYIVKPTKYSQIYEVFSRITAELDMRTGTEGEVEDAEYSIITSIKRYIRTHYAEATLERVADYVHLNPYYLSTFFKQQTGEKFSDYVVRVKMETAATLLERSEQSIKDIGAAVGYTNPNSFTRAFRQFYNCNPKDYRRTRLEK